MKKNMLFDLFFTFMKIGLFTFGGGYAMISIIENTCVEKKKWISHNDMLNVAVIAESTPGPIAINCATFVGYRQAGFPGSLAATLGVIVPSFTIIYIISTILNNFLEIPVISNAFKGIKIAVGILILDVAVTMIRKMPKKILPCTIMTFSLIAMFFINIYSWKISSIGLMLTAAAINLVIFVTIDTFGRKGGTKNDLS